MNLQVIHADETELFGELEGQSDPETKRKIIGKLFIDVFQKYADQIEGAEFLAQGTLTGCDRSVSFSGGPSVTSNRTTTSVACPKNGPEAGGAARALRTRSAPWA